MATTNHRDEQRERSLAEYRAAMAADPNASFYVVQPCAECSRIGGARCQWIARCTNLATHTADGGAAGPLHACDTCDPSLTVRSGPSGKAWKGTNPPIPRSAGSTDYSTSKYQDATTEAAYSIAGEGFAEAQAGDLSEGRDWCALVVVEGRCIIIREDAQGFVWTDYAETHHAVDHARIARAWADIEAETV